METSPPQIQSKQGIQKLDHAAFVADDHGALVGKGQDTVITIGEIADAGAGKHSQVNKGQAHIGNEGTIFSEEFVFDMGGTGKSPAE